MSLIKRATSALLMGLLPMLLVACSRTAEQPPPPNLPPAPPPKPAVVAPYVIAKHPICFGSGSAKIDESYDQDLIDMAVWLKEHLHVTITIEGHTDDRGTREYNLALGQVRAEEMRRALMKLGIPKKRMNAVGYGMERPLAAGTSEEARRQDRCAVAVIDKPDGR